MPNGEYVVKVDTSTLPSTAYVQTYDTDAPTNDNQSDVTVDRRQRDRRELRLPQESRHHQRYGGEERRRGRHCEVPPETAVANVTVFLTYAGADGILGTADDQVFTTTTNGSGLYTFSNLAPGSTR